MALTQINPRDTGTSVDECDYQVPFAFTGKLHRWIPAFSRMTEEGVVRPHSQFFHKLSAGRPLATNAAR
jgi:hypothetical protein